MRELLTLAAAVLALILLLCSGAKAVLPFGQCPSEQIIEPCTCTSEAFYSLHCDHLNNITVLENISFAASENSIRSINLTSSRMPYFPTRVLRNIRVNFLYLQRNDFEELFDVPVQLTNDIRHLVVRHSTPKNGWNWEQFRTFANLRILVVYDCDVGGRIRASSFGRYVTKDIESISLISVGIDSIEADAFSNHENLIHLRLSRNKLRTFERSSLPRPSRLTLLRLDHNEISYLSEDLFVDMPNLNDVRLSYNKVGILSEEVFGKIWKRNVSLQMQGNPVKCDCTLLWSLEREQKPRLLRGACHHPKSLYTKELTSLQPTELKCAS